MEHYKGLSEETALALLKKHGENALDLKKGQSALSILVDQFKSLFVIILILAAAFSYAVGEHIDSAAIIAIVIMNAVLGFVQEYRASKAIEALRKISVSYARVIREGIIKMIDAKYIVPGDIVLVEQGDKVPADCKVLHPTNFWCNEAIITGESRPIRKSVDDYAYASTIVSTGKAVLRVEATGKNTKFGKIAKLTAETVKEKSPLERTLENASRNIGILVLAIALAIFGANYALGNPPLDALMFSISLGVAAIPEGLPIVVTITLAIGLQRLAKKKAVVKRLLAVEGLGSVNVICSDKTGTITKNEMRVRKIWCGGSEYSLVGDNPANAKLLMGKKAVIPPKEVVDMLRCGMLCTDAEIENVEKPVGDSTEIAMLLAAKNVGLSKTREIEKLPLITEFNFDSSLKRMSTVHSKDEKYLICVKGAVEVLLERCNRTVSDGGRIVKMTAQRKNEIIKIMGRYANNAYRVMGVAYKVVDVNQPKLDREFAENDLIFHGMLAIYDAPREEVYNAIRMCRRAGIEVKMLTGDHKQTAIAIAKEIGLLPNNENMSKASLSGDELDRISENELEDIVCEVKVFSRVSPEQKLRILKALKRKGKVVAMTGDGVNDAPALKLADVGVAMGIMGTDVAKEAGDIILLDDNFATIVAAVKEGRTIFSNIKKFVYFLLSANFSEIIIISVMALLAELALLSSTGYEHAGSYLIPLLPLHLLWINLLTDGLPAVALGMDPPRKGIMRNYNSDNKLLSARNLSQLILLSIIISIPGIALFYYALANGFDVPLSRTIILTYLVVAELAIAMSIRTPRMFMKDMLSNRFLIAMIALTITIHILFMYTPSLAGVLKISALSFREWGWVIGAAAIPLIALEIAKFAFKDRVSLVA